MVFKKLLAGLGFGGVEVDTVLSAHVPATGGQLSGQVNLRAKSDTDVSAITLIVLAGGSRGEIELGRFPVAGGLRVMDGQTPSIPFTVPLPANTPFTRLYGKTMPGVGLGVRTEVSVASGSGKTDFDPVVVDAGQVPQSIVDALGTIGCRFVRNELRPTPGLGVPAAQAITFYAPIPEGQQPGPHIPMLTFLFAGAGPDTTTIFVELASRPGAADRHDVSAAEVARLSADNGWTAEVDRWVVAALDKLGQPAPAAPGSFMQPHQPQPGYAPQGRPGQYGYSGHGHQGYKYGGYHGRPGMGGALAAGLGGAALGFFGGMIIGDMISDAFAPDAEAADGGGTEDAGADSAGFEDAGATETGYDGGGYEDFGGGDFGGGDFGGDF
ncbi:sporulation protein [Hamadaea sp. NPDC050747]|uniref:sporulation protein n=1 Tax=Hamadaea sp. NPDC050747 TaxID=3155789 RepID=UPI0033D30AB9